ncbi:caspase family protein [Rhodoferax antarcticus]|uniref:caspase family protein n=1 Tax=Rhodoferax antarcticus TaxID=81479 RepID=UPI002224917E|nr:caspase family protein [Rhodoferax antarcticus]MCW2314354.1 hypothetical protein [Rhodoferax antarcticus]
MSFKCWLFGVAAVGALAGSGAGWAAPLPNYRALLVGVSAYPNFSEKLQLQGPKNDVRSMRELLVSRGVPVQNIKTLADGVEGAELPTRAAVLSALEQLAKTAKPNDYIVIHLGGHGSQQPVPENHPQAAAESDGLFEIFLPRDAKGWSNQVGGSDGEVQNAILDFEVRALVDRMTVAGAFVWAIFDTCHSATMVRSAGNSEVRLRQVTPDELGIPRGAIDKAEMRASNRAKTTAAPASRSPSPGQAVYFYAAQTHEPTPEANLPYGVPGRIPHGLFSFSLIQTLASANGPMSYEQLGQQVLTRYAANTGERSATPLFTGTALKSGVLGQQAMPYRQWILKRDQQSMAIPVGVLAEVYDGSIVAILPSAVAKSEESLGYAKVVRATATAAELEPVAYDGQPAVGLGRLAEGRVARMVQPGVQFALNVGVDLNGCAKPCVFDSPIATLQNGRNGGVDGAQVKWQASGNGADVVLKAQGRRLWLMSAGAAQTALPVSAEKHFAYLDAANSATAAGIQAEVARYLQHASKATNLLRIATSVAGNSATAALQIDLTKVTSAGETRLEGQTIQPGDKIRVTLRNTGRKALDVTAFYLNSKFGVDVMFPNGDESNRLEYGASTSIDIVFDDSTLGLERLAVVAVQAERLSELTRLSFLAQDKLEGSSVTRGAGGLGDLFTDAGFATHVNRGGKVQAPPSSTGMQVFTFSVHAK